MIPNYGKQPEASRGKRVMVELRNGRKPEQSWPADPPTRWSLDGGGWDIINWELAG